MAGRSCYTRKMQEKRAEEIFPETYISNGEERTGVVKTATKFTVWLKKPSAISHCRRPSYKVASWTINLWVHFLS